MSWNSSASRITEDQLDILHQNDPKTAHEIRTHWRKLFNPTTQKRGFVDPSAVRDLRAALVATLPHQPRIVMEKIENQSE